MKGKNWLTAATILILAGLCICVTAYKFFGFDFSGPTKGKNGNNGGLVTNTYEVKKDFRDIDIDGSVEDITFLPAKDGKCTVECLEFESQLHNVRVEGGTLKIDVKDDRSWSFGIVTGTPKITVYLPDEDYGKLEIDTDTGNVAIPKDFTFESIGIEGDTGDVDCMASEAGRVDIETDTGKTTVSDLKTNELRLKASTGDIIVTGVECKGDMTVNASTGDVSLKNVTCRNFNSKASTGELNMTNVIAEDTFTIERTTGHVKFDGCDAETIYVKTDTGDVTGTLLSDKVFLVDTDTGDVDVPKSITGGRCEIESDTGDIRLDVKK
jgi:DUF4097 and DUF4098 domain-containing protein YvlB